MEEKDELYLDTDILTLVDEDGVEHEFEMVDAYEEGEMRYAALIPIFDEAEDLLEDSGELLVLKVMTEEGQEFLEQIEDEEEFNRISAIFMERLKEEFDFEE